MNKIVAICGLIIAVLGVYIIISINLPKNEDDKSQHDSDVGVAGDLNPADFDQIAKLVLESYQNISVKEIDDFPHLKGLVHWVKYGSEIELYSKFNMYRDSPPSLENAGDRFDTPLRTAIEYSYNWHHPNWTNEWCIETFYNDDKALKWALMGRDDFAFIRDHAVRKFKEIDDDNSFKDQLRLIGELRFSSGAEAGKYDKAIVISEVDLVSSGLSFISGTPLIKIGERWYVDYMPDDLGSSLEDSINMITENNE